MSHRPTAGAHPTTHLCFQPYGPSSPQIGPRVHFPSLVQIHANLQSPDRPPSPSRPPFTSGARSTAHGWSALPATPADPQRGFDCTSRQAAPPPRLLPRLCYLVPRGRRSDCVEVGWKVLVLILQRPQRCSGDAITNADDLPACQQHLSRSLHRPFHVSVSLTVPETGGQLTASPRSHLVL